MKKNNKVKINNIFSDLILGHKISLLIIFLICILISFSYNNIYKSAYYNYSIKLETGQINYIENNLGDTSDQLSTRTYKKILFKKLRQMPKNVKDKKISYSGENNFFLISFNSFGRNKINLENFLNDTNTEIKEETLQDIMRIYENAMWSRNEEKYFDFNQVLELFEKNYPNIDARLPLDSFIEFKINEMNYKSSTEAKLNRLKYTIDN
ncbi:hypothetical protein OA524_02235, partial [Candidatus Pelagibacter sp.]|nr:hypothetical protein [Candidatus Pelagibacter sp.]